MAATAAPTLVPLESLMYCTPPRSATHSARCGRPEKLAQRLQAVARLEAQRLDHGQRGQRVGIVVPAAQAQSAHRQQRLSGRAPAPGHRAYREGRIRRDRARRGRTGCAACVRPTWPSPRDRRGSIRRARAPRRMRALARGVGLQRAVTIDVVGADVQHAGRAGVQRGRGFELEAGQLQHVDVGHLRLPAGRAPGCRGCRRRARPGRLPPPAPRPAW